MVPASRLVAVVVLYGVALASRRIIGHGPERSQLVAAKRGLGPLQRWHVRRAVARGRAVRDPALAAAAVAQARFHRAYSRDVRGLARLNVVLGVAMVVGAVVLLLAAHRLRLAAYLAVLGAFLTTTRWQQEFHGGRRDRSEDANLALLEAP